jgi:peptidoglycan/LPS O-acetylase OafA/YrhL
LAIGATASFIIFIGFVTGYTVAWEENPSYTSGYLIYQALRSLNTWCWIAFALAISSRFLNFRNKTLDYCSEAALPFYVLHQTVILAVGYYVVQWNLNILSKYLIISTTSFVVIMTLYDLLIRRNIALRFLFGMREKAQSPKIMAVTRD